jgi:hypothetical protein
LILTANAFLHRRKLKMKISKTRFFISLGLGVLLVLGTSYLFLALAQMDKSEAEVPSTAAIATQVADPIANSPLPPPGEPEHFPPKTKQAAMSRGAYPMSITAAAKPEKDENYSPPQYSYDGVLVLEGGETCDDAVVISVPHNSTGNTCDNVDDYEESDVFDCPYTSTSPDVVYSYSPSVDEVIDIDLYGSSYDTKVFVYEDICESAYLYQCNDDYYSDYTSAILGLPIYTGHTYFIVVDGYGGNCGDYLLDVDYYQECDVVCPEGGTYEDEPVCEDDWEDIWNGGCNSDPIVFDDIYCGDTICGTSGVYDYYGSTYRDMDWFRLELDAPGTITWTGVGEFPVALWIQDAGSEDCSDNSTIVFDNGLTCDTVSISTTVQAGVYWLLIAPKDWGDYPCGVEYVAWLDCELATTGACCLDYDPYTCTIETPEDCEAMPDHTFKGLGTDCDPNPCLPAPDNDECENAVALSLPVCPTTLVVDGTTIGATIDCPGELDWPAVWYTFELTYDCNSVFIDFCEMDIALYSVGAVIFDECPPDCPNYILYTEGGFITCPNELSNAQMWYKNLPPGQYWLPLHVEDFEGNMYMDFSFGICVEECFPEPGDNCASPVTVTVPADLPYTNTNYTCARVNDYENTCLGSYDGGEDIIYEVTVTDAVDVNITMDPKGTTWTGLAIDDECPPADPCMASNTGSSGIRSIPALHLDPGTYYIMVDTWPSPDCIPDFDLTIEELGEAPENDTCGGAPVVSTFPTTVYGTTVGATIDCPGVLDWDAVWYRFDLPYATNNILVDFCPTDGYIATVGVVLYDECPPDCPNYILRTGYEWVSCPSGYSNPHIWWNNLPGPASYWFPVYVVPGKKGQMDFGFEVSVEEAMPCSVFCPPGGYDEGEGYCYDDYDDTYNSGCNGSPFVFQQLACGDTICGSCGVFDYFGSTYRDMDWFEVDVSEGDLTLTCVAEFPLALWLFDPVSFDCEDLVNLDFINTTETCDTLSVSAYVTPGTYWLIIAPMDWGSYPCGDQSEYVAWLDCTPFGPQMAVSPASMYPVLNPSGDCSTAEENLVISSVGGEDLTYSIVENPAVDWMELSSYGGTIPPDDAHTLTVSFDAGGMAPGDYYCDLEITHNDPGQPSPYVVAVHLEVELAPEIDLQPRLWVPVVPDCETVYPLRIGNSGEGTLDFHISVSQNPPTPAAAKSDLRQALEALEQARQSDPSLTPRAAVRTIGAKKSAIEYHSTGASEGLLFTAGAGKQAEILVVDDDGGLPNGSYSDIEYAYLDALDANGLVYDYYLVDWAEPLSNGPDLATMQNYSCIIWFTGETWGYYGDDTVTDTDENNLAAFLDGGGNLFLSAQDYLYESYPSAGSFSSGDFPYDYLGVSYADQDAWQDDYTVYGGVGSVANDMQFDADRCYATNPDVPLWTDVLTGQGSFMNVFLIYETDPSAVQYDGGNFKTVFTTTEFCGLLEGTPSYRADLMASIMDWFGCGGGGGCPFTVDPEEGEVPAESFFDVFLTFDGTRFTECVDETLTCYLSVTSNDCDEPLLTVDVMAMSARGDVTGDCKLDIADVVFLLNYVFFGSPAPDPMCIGDLDRDTDVDSDDALYLISYLFEYGAPPEIPAAPTQDQTPFQLK